MEAPHGMADRFAHALDLMLAALVQCQLELRGAEPAHVRGRGRTVIELYACGELLQRGLIGLAFDVELVHLLDAVTRMCESMGERAVVREQQGAGGVRVEA